MRQRPRSSSAKVLALLRQRGLLSEDRIELLLSWRRSGFSVHNRVFVHPRDGREFEALVRYMMRPPVSLSRLHFTPGSHLAALRRRWAELIRRVYEVDPLVCPRCGGEMRVETGDRRPQAGALSVRLV